MQRYDVVQREYDTGIGMFHEQIDLPCEDGKYVLAEDAIVEIKKYRDFVIQLGEQLDMLDGAECACYDISKFLHATSPTQK